MTLFENIKSLSLEKGVSLPKLEQELGFSKGSLYTWVKSSPSIDKVKKVADYLGVSIDEILVASENNRSIDKIKEDQQESEMEEFEQRLRSRYTQHDYLWMLKDFFMTEVSYVQSNEGLKFLPHYQKHFDTELEILGLKYKVDFGHTPDSVESACGELENKEITREVLTVLKKARNDVDLQIRFGKIPPPVPVTEIQTIAANFDGDEFTAEELEEIKEYAKFLKSKRKG